MRFRELYEIRRSKSTKKKSIEFKYLYHLTDYSGLVQSIFADSLKSRSQDYISTTFTPNMNHVVGRDFYHFKFILDGVKLAQDYGVYEVSDYHYVGSELNKMDEDEMGVDTDEITPLSKYAKGLVILINPFSRMFLQWLFYDSKTDYNNIGAHAIEKWLNQGNALYRQEKKEIRTLNEDEVKLIKAAIKLGEDNITFSDALMTLSDQFPIADHMSGYVSSAQVRRERKRKEAVQILNNTLANRPIDDIEVDEIENMLIKIITELGYDRAYVHKILTLVRQLGLNTPLVSPVDWSSLIRNLIRGEPWEEIVEDLKFTKEDKLEPTLRRLERYQGKYMNDKHTPAAMA